MPKTEKRRQAFETLEKICIAFQVPMCYFFDNSIYEYNNDKNQLIDEITSKLKIMDTKSLKRINSLINFVDFS